MSYLPWEGRQGSLRLCAHYLFVWDVGATCVTRSLGLNLSWGFYRGGASDWRRSGTTARAMGVTNLWMIYYTRRQKKKKKREGVKTSNRISIVSHIQICQTPTWSKAHDAGFKRFQFISEFNSFSKILIILSLTHKMLKYREEKTRLTISVCIRVHVHMCICTRPYLDVGTEFC